MSDVRRRVRVVNNRPGTPSRMRQVRDAQGLTQQRLAFLTGMSIRAIQNVEGGIAEPGLKTAQLIAKALGTTVDDLFGAAA